MSEPLQVTVKRTGADAAQFCAITTLGGSMPTFNETVANFTTPQEVECAEIKTAVLPTRSKMLDRQRAYAKQLPAWLSRGEHVQDRVRKAQARGVSHARVNFLLEELYGGRFSNRVGLFHGTQSQIVTCIQKIESLSPQNLPQRDSWITWHSEPNRVDDNLRAIEDYMVELEKLVGDHGELHRMLDAKSEKTKSEGAA